MRCGQRRLARAYPPSRVTPPVRRGRAFVANCMQSPRKCVEDYLKKEARFLQVCNTSLQSNLFDAQRVAREAVLDVSQSRTRATVVTSGSGERY